MKSPIFKEVILASIIFLILALFCYTVSYFLLGGLNVLLNIILVLFLFFQVLYFYRDPERIIIADANHIQSPADGRIFNIQKRNNRQIIKIFVSLLDMHVQRALISGTVKSIIYKKGRFIAAYDKREEYENEQNVTVISTKHGDIEIKQIAGILV